MTRVAILASAILTILAAVPLIPAALISNNDSFIEYTGLGLQMAVMSLVAFVLLIIGSVFGIIGVRRQNLKCVLVLFFCLLFSFFWLFGLSVYADNLYSQYGPK